MSPVRTLVSWLLALAACGLTVVALAATWMDRQVMGTDRWTQTSVEVLRDQDVQDLTAAFLADQLVDQQEAIAEALPPALRPFSGTATAVLRDTAERVALEALRARALEDLWAQASRGTHRQFVRWLEGQDATRRGDQVTLELQPAIDRLAERVGISPALIRRASSSRGDVTVVLIRGDAFDRTRRDAHRLEQAASLTLPLAIVVGALSVLVATRRRWALVRVGLAAGVAGLIVLAAAPTLQASLVDGLVEGGAARPVARAILDATVPELVRAGWLTAVGGGVLAVLAFATRPGRRRAAA